jgi:deoxycytidylate deaminase
MQNIPFFFEEAGKVATQALCLRDKCGAVIVKNNSIIGAGYNAPPCDDVRFRKCELDLRVSKKPKSDRTCCLHAEWRAILDAVKKAGDIAGSTLYFVRVNTDGVIKESDGVPYCTVCSRLALDVGVTSFCLWTKDGAKCYGTDVYNDISYQFHGKL